jgi:type III secretion protein V
VIQFVVIAKGGERVAEVAARFVPDAMPGKQMAIDAELRAGSIDGAEARKRRRSLSRESRFYGSMGGAMRFVTKNYFPCARPTETVRLGVS